MKMKRFYVAGFMILFFTLATLFTTMAYAATIHVPADQPTIQAGIDAAVAGDTVLVADGTYTGAGNTNILWSKAITIKSENGSENCIIDCEGTARAFFFGSGVENNSTLSGFTITRGGDGEAVPSETIRCDGSPIISNCIISSSVKTGIFLYNINSSSTIIKNCIISNGSQNAVYCMGSSPTLINCTIVNNTCVMGDVVS